MPILITGIISSTYLMLTCIHIGIDLLTAFQTSVPGILRDFIGIRNRASKEIAGSSHSLAIKQSIHRQSHDD